MAYHIYDRIDYYKVMMIAVCDMQFEDIEDQCIMWKKLNVVVENKRVKGTPIFKGFMVDSAQVKECCSYCLWD